MSETIRQDVISDIQDIMRATDPVLFFGTNAKRARIRYRRLMRNVHPDVAGEAPETKEAAIKLNSLWQAYGDMTRASGSPSKKQSTRQDSHFVHELARTGRFALFAEGTGWLVVNRLVGTIPMAEADVEARKRLAILMEGSPVTLLREVETKSIRQPDGIHQAVVCETPGFYDSDHHLLSLAGIKHHVPDGIMAPEDVAWVLKRLLFLVAALAKVGLRPETGCDLADMVVIDAEAHMLILVMPQRLVGGAGTVSEQRDCLGNALAILSGMIDVSDHSGIANRRLRAFMRGVGVDYVTETSDLLSELNDLLLELFGEPRFHEISLTPR